jgi:hypothetical protein
MEFGSFFYSVLSAIGAVALVWLGASIAHRNERQRNRESRLQSKLEELYKLSLNLDNWNSQAQADATTGFNIIQASKNGQYEYKDNVKVQDACPIDQMEMMVAIYFDQLEDPLNSVKTLEESFRNGLLPFILSANTIESKQQAIDALEREIFSPQSDVGNANAELRKAIKSIADKWFGINKFQAQIKLSLKDQFYEWMQ